MHHAMRPRNDEKRQEARRLRKSGQSFAAIGRTLHVSRQRAMQFCTLAAGEYDTGACEHCRVIAPQLIGTCDPNRPGGFKLLCCSCAEKIETPFGPAAFTIQPN